MMNHLIPVCGYLGLILSLTGAYLYATDAASRMAALITLLIGAALIATFAVFEWTRVRSTLEQRSTRYGANAVAMTLILICILTFVNLIGSRYSKRVDTTANQRFSLADLTERARKTRSGRAYHRFSPFHRTGGGGARRA